MMRHHRIESHARPPSYTRAGVVASRRIVDRFGGKPGRGGKTRTGSAPMERASDMIKALADAAVRDM